MKRGRKWMIAFGGLAIVAAVGAAIWFPYRRAANAEAVGIYLVDGGESLLRIEQTKAGGLGMVSPSSLMMGLFGGPDPSMHISSSGSVSHDHLIIQERVDIEDEGRMVVMLEFAPSAERRGDWDLVDVRGIASEAPDASIFSGSYWEALSDSDSVGEFFGTLISPFSGGEKHGFRRDPALAPARSYLHRIDDSRLTTYYATRQRGEPADNALAWLKPILTDHPEDPWLLAQCQELEARSGAIPAAEATRGRLAKLIAASGTPASLTRMAARAEETLRVARQRRDQPDLRTLADIAESWHSRTPTLGLEDVLAWLRRLGEMPELIAEDYPIVVATGQIGVVPQEYLASRFADDAIRLAITEATLERMRGQRGEAQELLTGAWRLTQAIDSHSSLGIGYYGISTSRLTSLAALKLFALEGGSTAPEVAQLSAMLAKLDTAPEGADAPPRLANFSPLDELFMIDEETGKGFRNPGEILDNWVASEALMRLLRMAVAARGHRLATGSWPAAPGDFAPWLPDGPLADPLATSATLQYRLDGDDLVLWSVGIDRHDSVGKMAPGSIGTGAGSDDILVRVPARPAFAIPPGGLRARNADDLLAQFPEGLPADPYSNFQRPLIVLDATSTQPLVIFSSGPDGDAPLPNRYPDPYGDNDTRQLVFRRVWPDPREAADPEARFKLIAQGVKAAKEAAEPAGATDGATSKTEKLPRPPLWLDPIYDPTNGTRSQGDLFIEIPPPRGGELPSAAPRP